MNPEPWTDEIVEEVRRNREELLREHDYDLHKLAASLRESQKRHGDKLVFRVGRSNVVAE